MRTAKIMSVILLLIVPVAWAGSTLTTTEAAKHIVERATVIATEHTATSSHGTPTFINLDKPYPDQVFTVPVGSVTERMLAACRTPDESVPREPSPSTGEPPRSSFTLVRNGTYPGNRHGAAIRIEQRSLLH